MCRLRSCSAASVTPTFTRYATSGADAGHAHGLSLRSRPRVVGRVTNAVARLYRCVRDLRGNRLAAPQRWARFAVATLVERKNAAPAPIGTSLIVDSDGSFAGNIGGGCHESEIVEAARSALRDGVGRTLEFDINDELLDGLACGASLAVAIWLPATEFVAVADRIVAGDEAVTFSCGGRPFGVGGGNAGC